MNTNPSGGNAELSNQDVESLEKLNRAYGSVRRELGKIIVGQNEVIEQLMIAIFCPRPLLA